MTWDLIERMYSDFTTNVVPLLGQGVQITKDYAMEFLGRYWKFLIVYDSFYVILSLIWLIIWVVFARKAVKVSDDEGRESRAMPLLAVAIILLLIWTIAIFKNWWDLIKSIYVPEIRMYEEFKSIR